MIVVIHAVDLKRSIPIYNCYNVYENIIDQKTSWVQTKPN